MKHTTSHALFTYWNEIRGQRVAPRRFEIEPARLSAILPDTFILDCGEPGLHRFRLAGTRMSSLLGRDLRDSALSGLFEASEHATLRHALAQAIDQAAVIVLTAVATPAGSPAALVSPDAGLEPGPRIEFVLLPLFHMQNQVTRLLGSAVALEPAPPGRPQAPALQRLVGQETIWPDGRPQSVLQQLHRQSPFAPELRTGRIVTSDRRRFRGFDGGKAP